MFLNPLMDKKSSLMGRVRSQFLKCHAHVHGDTNNNGNNFIFGTQTTPALNPTANFFGLPILSKLSTDIISYKISVEDVDEDWLPADDKNLVDLKLFVKGVGSGNAPNTTNYINWSNQANNKPWTGAGVGSFPLLPVPLGGNMDFTGTFDLSGNTGTKDFGVTTNKYSRNLLPSTYTFSSANTTNPLFFVEGTYDNNILRQFRGITGSSLENNPRRTIDASFNSLNNENRFEGKGVGLNGQFSLFWDHTFNTSTSLNNVGNIDTGTLYFKEFPFVEDGVAPDYTQTYNHSILLDDGTTAAAGANSQLVWAKDGFKPGGWSVTEENPYITYHTKYWFGIFHPTVFRPDYLRLNNSGETLSTLATIYSTTAGIDAGGTHRWWSNAGQSSFTWSSTLKWKFIVIKCPVPARPGSDDLVVSLSIKKGGASSFDEVPMVDASDLSTPTLNNLKPVVWMQEKGNSTTHPANKLPVGPPFSPPPGFPNWPADKTGWMATHLSYNQGAGQNSKTNNNSGIFDGTIFTDVTGNPKVFRTFGTVGTSAGSFDVYFRIGIPNGCSYDIEAVSVQFKRWNSTAQTLTNITGTNGTQTFTYKQ